MLKEDGIIGLLCPIGRTDMRNQKFHLQNTWGTDVTRVQKEDKVNSYYIVYKSSSIAYFF
jgi:hypothetical protein